ARASLHEDLVLLRQGTGQLLLDGQRADTGAATKTGNGVDRVYAHQPVTVANQFRLAVQVRKAFIFTTIDTRMQHFQRAHVIAAHINKTTAEIAVAGGLRHVLEQLLCGRFTGRFGRLCRNLRQGDYAGERLQQCSPCHQRLSLFASWVTKRTPPMTPWPLWRDTNSLWRTIIASIRSLSACREAACA